MSLSPSEVSDHFIKLLEAEFDEFTLLPGQDNVTVHAWKGDRFVRQLRDAEGRVISEW